MEKISVIVPIYNSEAYLEKCLNSIVNQTYPNIEVILVNDGSADKSSSICKAFQNEHENFKYFEMDENFGVSHSRNFGLEHAQGSFIGFVDSDDWIDTDMYESLHEVLVSHNVPMVSANFRQIKHDDKRVVKVEHIHCNDLYIGNTHDALMYIISNRDVVLWNKLYRREVFNDIVFPEGKVYEDIAAIHLLAENAGRFAVSTKCLYNYLSRPKSITRNKTDLVMHFEHLYVVVERYEYLSHKYNSEKLEQLCRQQIFATLAHVVDKLNHINIESDKRVYDEYSKAKRVVFDNYSYENCGFCDAEQKVLESLMKSIEHYKISRDLLRTKF